MVKIKQKKEVKHPLEDVDCFIGVELTTLEDYEKWDAHLNATLKLMAKYYDVEIDKRAKHPFLQAEVNCLIMCIQNVRYWMRVVAKVRFGKNFELEKDQFKVKEYLDVHMDYEVLKKFTEQEFKGLTKKQKAELDKIDGTFQMFRLFGKTMITHFYKTLNYEIINRIVAEVLDCFPLAFC